MLRERVLKILMVLVGLIFVAALYPLVLMFSRDPAVAMMMSLYVTMGIFLLLASRNPSAHRSLIAFVGWANVAHAAIMSVQEYRHVIERRELLGVAVFGIIGAALIALTPAKSSGERVSAAAV